MKYFGTCKCQAWRICISLAEPLATLNPRVCDCEYCKAQPSAIVSHPGMRIDVAGDQAQLTFEQNGDRLANFYRCRGCGDLLAVGREIKGRLRGAVNARLLERWAELGEQVSIQPRLLAAVEKLVRWEKLWGELDICGNGGSAEPP